MNTAVSINVPTSSAARRAGFKAANFSVNVASSGIASTGASTSTTSTTSSTSGLVVRRLLRVVDSDLADCFRLAVVGRLPFFVAMYVPPYLAYSFMLPHILAKMQVLNLFDRTVNLLCRNNRSRSIGRYLDHILVHFSEFFIGGIIVIHGRA